MAKQELLVEVKKLISIGKEKGFLTYDELNSTLPAEVVSSEQFGSIIVLAVSEQVHDPRNDGPVVLVVTGCRELDGDDL